MNQSIEGQNVSKDNSINDGSCQDCRVAKFKLKSIKSIFEEKFLIEPNGEIDCRIKKHFQYLNCCYTVYMCVTNINFSIVISRNGELINILINQNKEIKRTQNKQDLEHNLFEIIPSIKFEIFEKIYRSINVNNLKDFFYDVFELSLINIIRLISGSYFNFNNEITYKFSLNSAVELLILIDDSGRLIDIISEKEKCEYSRRIKESIKLENYKFKTPLN